MHVAVSVKEKRHALRAHSPIPSRCRSGPPALRPSFFVSPTERDRYPRLYYKYTCNSASPPTVRSVYTSASVYVPVCIIRVLGYITQRALEPVCIRVPLARTAGTISAFSIHTDNTRGGSRLREARHNLSLIAPCISLHSFSLSRLHALLARGPAARTGH